MSRHIGIDLGTTNSVVAFIDGGRSETIPNAEGHKTTPSVVLYKEDAPVVGELAKRQWVTHPRSTIRSVKRLMGQRFSEVKSWAQELPFTVVEGPEDRAMIQLESGARMTPEEVSAAILEKMRETAEDFLGEDVQQAVITVPAHFNDSQRVATKRAAELAGLEAMRIINEPTAAALAYGIGRSAEELIAVFDLGGGTFDISILQLSKGIFEVLSTNGDNHLGGDNFDRALAQWIIHAIREETFCDPEADPQALQRIYETAEKVKCELSTLTSTVISLPFIVADASGPKHFSREITREQFVDLIRPLLDRIAGPCEQALADANLRPERLSQALLVGGSTRIPAVQEIVRRLFGKEPNRSVNPDEAVALGAAIQAGVISGDIEEILLLDVAPLSLGIELAGGVFKTLIPRNSSIPTTATRRFTTVVDNQQSVMVHVLQGERARAAENRTLARLRLTGIAPAPREVPEIEVRFHIDANGILEVSAQDLTSGAAQSVVVESYSAAASSEAEVKRAVSEAEAHAQEDQMYVQRAPYRQRIEEIQHRMSQFLELVGDQITEADLKKIKESMIKLDLVLRSEKWLEIDAIEHDFQALLKNYGSLADLAARSAQAMEFRLTAADSGIPDLDAFLSQEVYSSAMNPQAAPEAPQSGAAESAAPPKVAPADTPEIENPIPPAAPSAREEPAAEAAAEAEEPDFATIEDPGREAAPPAPVRDIHAQETMEYKAPPVSQPAAKPVPRAPSKKFQPPSWLFPGQARKPGEGEEKKGGGGGQSA